MDPQTLQLSAEHEAHTPESIEAISFSDVVAIKKLADELHEQTAGTLETPMSASDVESQMRLRSALKLKVAESIGWIAGQIADLEGIKRDLAIKKSYATTDESRLESYMFQRIRAEKTGQA